MIRRCALLDSLLTRTAFQAFAPGPQCTASSVIPRPESFAFCAGGKHSLWGLWSKGQELLRSQSAPHSGSLLWRYSDLSGDRTPAGVLPELRPREAREAALGGRQSVLHQALCLVRWATVPGGNPPSCRSRIALGLANGQGVGQAVHAGAVAASGDACAAGSGGRRDRHPQGAYVPHRGQRLGPAACPLVWREGSLGRELG